MSPPPTSRSCRFRRVVPAMVLVLVLGAIAGSCADSDASDAAKDSRVQSSYGDGPDRFGVLHLPSRPSGHVGGRASR